MLSWLYPRRVYAEGSSAKSNKLNRTGQDALLDIKGAGGKGNAALTREDAETRRVRIRRLFETLDDNKTGFLDHDNITRRLEELAHAKQPKCDRQRSVTAASSMVVGSDGKERKDKRRGPVGSTIMYARELVKECDKTKDGRITFAEFEAFVHSKEVELANVFRQIDSSGDHTIQEGELRQFVTAAGIQVTEKEIRNLLNRLDRDRTGSITYDEWRDYLLLLPRTATPENIFNFHNSIYNVDVNSDSMPFPDNLRAPESVAQQRIRYFLCGGLSGAVSRTVTAPLDRLKVLLVTQTAVPWAGPGAPPVVSTPTSTGAIIGGIRRIYQQGGIRSFYRGNGINVLKIAPESGMKFFTFETMKNAVAKVEGVNHADYISVPGRFLAGGFAGLVSQFTIYPLETVKTRIMAQIAETASVAAAAAAGPRAASATSSTPFITSTITSPGEAPPQHHLNPNHQQLHHQHKPPPPQTKSRSRFRTEQLITRTMRQMYRENGIRTFYRGCIPSLIGIVPYAGIDLGTYETLRSGYEKRLRLRTGKKDAKASSLRLLGFGAVSAATGAVIMYPLSVIRTRLQAQGTPSHPYRYTSSFDVIRKTYAREGALGFYKGLAPTLMKVLPAVSISYVVYEKTKNMV